MTTSTKRTKNLSGVRRNFGILAGLFGGLLALSPASASAQPPGGYVTTPKRYVEVDKVRLAYRSVGESRGAPPLVLLQHFTGTMDDWDSAMIDGLARHRRVIVLGNPGVGASGGPAPDSVAGMAHLAEGFVDALKVGKVDVLGFSIGGSVAQLIVAERPELVRKLILVGAGPRAARASRTSTPSSPTG